MTALAPPAHEVFSDNDDEDAERAVAVYNGLQPSDNGKMKRGLETVAQLPVKIQRKYEAHEHLFGQRVPERIMYQHLEVCDRQKNKTRQVVSAGLRSLAAKTGRPVMGSRMHDAMVQACLDCRNQPDLGALDDPDREDGDHLTNARTITMAAKAEWRVQTAIELYNTAQPKLDEAALAINEVNRRLLNDDLESQEELVLCRKLAFLKKKRRKYEEDVNRAQMEYMSAQEDLATKCTHKNQTRSDHNKVYREMDVPIEEKMMRIPQEPVDCARMAIHDSLCIVDFTSRENRKLMLKLMEAQRLGENGDGPDAPTADETALAEAFDAIEAIVARFKRSDNFTARYKTFVHRPIEGSGMIVPEPPVRATVMAEEVLPIQHVPEADSDDDAEAMAEA